MKESNKISVEVFILTGEWGDYNSRNILKFIGTSDKLGAVEISITNNKPVFFIDNTFVLDSSTKNCLRKETHLKNFNHQPVDAIYLNTQKELRDLTDKIHQSDITTYESDVDPLRRFLMEKSINSQMLVSGLADKKESITKFINPNIKQIGRAHV